MGKSNCRLTQATAHAFGFSRVTLYQLRKRFEAEGLSGLLPRPKGPRRAHKLSSEVMAFVVQALESDPELRALDLQQRVEQRFGILVHPRSIERALKLYQKRG